MIERAAREFRDRYGRSPHAGELSSIAVATRGTKTVTAEVDVSSACRAVGEEYGLTRGKAEALFKDGAREPERDVRGELLADVTRERSMIDTREPQARAFELAAGIEGHDSAREHLAELQRSGELVARPGVYASVLSAAWGWLLGRCVLMPSRAPLWRPSVVALPARSAARA